MAWYVTDGSQEFGPYSDETLRKIAASGKLKPDSAVRCDGGQWFEARYVNGLFPGALTIGGLPKAIAVQESKPRGGVILIAIGLLLLAFFLVAFDVSVPTSTGGRVNNIGLMNDRQIGMIVGAVFVVFGALKRYRR